MSATQSLVPTSLEPRTIAEAENFAEKLARSNLMPNTLRGKPADVLVVMLTGHELGVSPLTALRSIHVVQGRPVLDAALIVAMVKKSAACEYFQLCESTAERATYEAKRKGEPTPTRMSFTMEDAKRAGLTGKDNWKNYPAAMLRARCSSALARAVFPDLVLNVLTEDEADEVAARETRGTVTVEEAPKTKPAPTEDVADAEVVEETGPSDDDLIADWGERFGAATTLADLDKVSADLAALKLPKGRVRAELLDIYHARKAVLAGGEV